MIFVVAVRRQHLENPPCDIHRRWIQHGVVVGKRNVLEDHSVVVFVERSPAAITALHGENPVDGALDRLSLIAAVRMLDVSQCQAHHGAVIHVGIKLVVEFEIPTAGLAFPVLHFPIAHGADLLLQDPVGALDHAGIIRRHSAFAEGE